MLPEIVTPEIVELFMMTATVELPTVTVEEFIYTFAPTATIMVLMEVCPAVKDDEFITVLILVLPTKNIDELMVKLPPIIISDELAIKLTVVFPTLKVERLIKTLEPTETFVEKLGLVALA